MQFGVLNHRFDSMSAVAAIESRLQSTIQYMYHTRTLRFKLIGFLCATLTLLRFLLQPSITSIPCNSGMVHEHSLGSFALLLYFASIICTAVRCQQWLQQKRSSETNSIVPAGVSPGDSWTADNTPVMNAQHFIMSFAGVLRMQPFLVSFNGQFPEVTVRNYGDCYASTVYGYHVESTITPCTVAYKATVNASGVVRLMPLSTTTFDQPWAAPGSPRVASCRDMNASGLMRGGPLLAGTTFGGASVHVTVLVSLSKLHEHSASLGVLACSKSQPTIAVQVQHATCACIGIQCTRWHTMNSS
jgi:hypothetical protein